MLFFIVDVPIYITTNRIEGFPFLHTFSSIYCLNIFWWWLPTDMKCLFRFLLRRNFYLDLLTIFNFLFFDIELHELFVLLETNPLLVTLFANIFSHFVGCFLFCLWFSISLSVQKLLNLIRFHLCLLLLLLL